MRHTLAKRRAFPLARAVYAQQLGYSRRNVLYAYGAVEHLALLKRGAERAYRDSHILGHVSAMGALVSAVVSQYYHGVTLGHGVKHALDAGQRLVNRLFVRLGHPAHVVAAHLVGFTQIQEGEVRLLGADIRDSHIGYLGIGIRILVLVDELAVSQALRACQVAQFFPGVEERGIKAAFLNGFGEDPQGIPNNLTPYITQVAIGRRDKVHVFGNDYPTKDGTGVRDYIHVVDLATGHVAAIKYAAAHSGSIAINLGTGVGYSVLDMISAFSRAVGKEIPYTIDARRPGDIAECYADPKLAYDLLGWKAVHTLDDMCADSWRWQQQNPYGYSDKEA